MTPPQNPQKTIKKLSINTTKIYKPKQQYGKKLKQKHWFAYKLY
jgi:hypothetical protein